MNGILDQSEASNQSKIEKLKQKIKKVDSIHPKSTIQSTFPNQPPLSFTNNFNLTPMKQVNIISNQKESLIHLQVRYHELQQKINARFDHQQKLLQSIDGQIQSLQQEARNLKKQFERGKEISQEKATVVERDTADDILQQIEETKVIRKELVQSIQKKYKTIKSETMVVLGSHFQNGWQQAREEIVKIIEDLRARIYLEETLRDEDVNGTVNRLGQEILKLEQQVQRERSERVESHEKLMSAILQAEEELTGLIFNEKRQAALGIAELENNLEELCFKIENHLLR